MTLSGIVVESVSVLRRTGADVHGVGEMNRLGGFLQLLRRIEKISGGHDLIDQTEVAPPLLIFKEAHIPGVVEAQ